MRSASALASKAASHRHSRSSAIWRAIHARGLSGLARIARSEIASSSLLAWSRPVLGSLMEIHSTAYESPSRRRSSPAAAGGPLLNAALLDERGYRSIPITKCAGLQHQLGSSRCRFGQFRNSFHFGTFECTPYSVGNLCREFWRLAVLARRASRSRDQPRSASRRSSRRAARPLSNCHPTFAMRLPPGSARQDRARAREGRSPCRAHWQPIRTTPQASSTLPPSAALISRGSSSTRPDSAASPGAMLKGMTATDISGGPVAAAASFRTATARARAAPPSSRTRAPAAAHDNFTRCGCRVPPAP